jgi:hypothetical protein
MKALLARIEVGQTVYVVRYNGYGHTYTKGLVTKVTPKGSSDIKIGASENVTRFNPDGREIGGLFREWQVDDQMSVEERDQWLAKQALIKKASNAIKDLMGEGGSQFTYSQESATKKLDELQARVDAARALVPDLE